MRLVALLVLVIGNLFANQVLAEDASTQPLTRVDCDKAELTWNDGANVCGATSQAAEAGPDAQGLQTAPFSEVAHTAGQPLTREDCDKAELTWNDGANVCGPASQAVEIMPEGQEPVTQTALEETSPITSTVLINI